MIRFRSTGDRFQDRKLRELYDKGIEMVPGDENWKALFDKD